MISGNQLEILQHFKSFLSEAKLSSVSIKNYLSDIRRYFEWLQTSQGREGTIRDLTESTAKAYLDYLADRNTPQ
ncbi:phage integrase N-terminal SAM-like domain-containing protein, partial [Candidatus Collierbacteria bacterium]|nr:phage integrase N-terminal SAM-like domain-containing protein [Candidatus Collierbacteria bacterium]